MKWNALVLTLALGLAASLGAARPASAAERVYPRRDVRFHQFYNGPYRSYGYHGYWGPHVGFYAHPGPYPYVAGPYPYAYGYPPAPYGYVGFGPRLRFGVRFGW